MNSVTGMIRGWRERRRYQHELALVYEDRRARMPWLQLAAALHHTQHPGEVRDDCGRCRPERMVELLDEMSPLPVAP